MWVIYASSVLMAARALGSLGRVFSDHSEGCAGRMTAAACCIGLGMLAQALWVIASEMPV